MYIVAILNEKGQRFEEIYYSEYLFKNRLNIIKHSKRLTLLSWSKEY